MPTSQTLEASYAPVAADPAIEPIDAFVGARDQPGPADRLAEVRRRSQAFREQMLDTKRVVYYRSRDLVRVPYPTRYAFSGVFFASPLTSPLVHILNRVFIVQFDSAGGLKTLLFSPSEVDDNEHTPFFKRISAGLGSGRVGELSRRAVAPVYSSVPQVLEEAGLTPGDIDYISFDHLHTQDLRHWLGSGDRESFFPRAQLLVMRQEWESTRALLPTQADWYCPDGIRGVDPARVVVLDGSVRLGEGVALVATPGHTEGNHSLVAHTDDGLMVTSENGVGPDAYAPLESRMGAVRKHAQATGQEVILNGNTQESSVDQYISMVMEKEIAGPSPRKPAFPNLVCSSELSAYPLFPRINPTFAFGELEFGRVASNPD
jgi:hypothetical protein